MSTIAALTVALDLDKSQYQRKLKAAQSDGEKAKLKLERVFSRVALGGAAAAGIAMAANALGKMAEAGGRALTIQAAFNRATGDGVAAIQSMRDATMGLVSDTELMTQANMALTLGSANNAQQFSDLAKTAQQLGRALGLDTAFALNSLNVGIARQSRLVLDNLGLIVSVEQANIKYAAALGKTVAQLTDLEKKEAFRIEAMEMAKEKLEALGPTTRNAGDAFVAFRTEVTNSFDALKKGVAESDLVMRFFDGLATEIERVRVGYYEMERVLERSPLTGQMTWVSRQKGDKAFEEQANRQLNRELLANAPDVLNAEADAERARIAEAEKARIAGINAEIERLTASIDHSNEFLTEHYHQLTGLATTEEILARQMEIINAEMEEFNNELIQINPSLDHLNHTATDWQAVAADAKRHTDEWREAQEALREELEKTGSALGNLGRLTGILGSVASFFNFGGAAGVISKVASGIGLVGQVGSMADLREHPGSGVVVNINGPGLETLVDTITVQQGRSRELRRVRRV
tara:strand:+ start:11054 stop:12619 length:1566 start_codon:yes stop_codon:yes gene_type:complete